MFKKHYIISFAYLDKMMNTGFGSAHTSSSTPLTVESYKEIEQDIKESSDYYAVTIINAMRTTTRARTAFRYIFGLSITPIIIYSLIQVFRFIYS